VDYWEYSSNFERAKCRSLGNDFRTMGTSIQFDFEIRLLYLWRVSVSVSNKQMEVNVLTGAGNCTSQFYFLSLNTKLSYKMNE
jgi:hypothetical protein